MEIVNLAVLLRVKAHPMCQCAASKYVGIFCNCSRKLERETPKYAIDKMLLFPSPLKFYKQEHVWARSTYISMNLERRPAVWMKTESNISLCHENIGMSEFITFLTVRSDDATCCTSTRVTCNITHWRCNS